MHIHFQDPYQPRSSPVHTLDPKTKLLLALGFILTTSLTPVGAWPVYLLLFALVFSAEILSDLGAGYVLRRSALALPFVLAALPLLFTTPGDPILSIPVGTAAWQISGAGVSRMVSLALKSWISVQAAILLAITTPFPELLSGLRALHLPRLLVATIGLMWRYLFLLVDEAMRLLRARSARSGRSSDTSRRLGGTLAWRARVTGGMAGSLFLRSLERSDRVYQAMLARGYDGEIRNPPPSSVYSSSPWVLPAGLVFLALLLTFAVIFYGS